MNNIYPIKQIVKKNIVVMTKSVRDIRNESIIDIILLDSLALWLLSIVFHYNMQ